MDKVISKLIEPDENLELAVPVPLSNSLEPSDEQLVKLAQQGHLDEFNLLVIRHEKRVFNVCLRLLGDSDMAADASQDCFILAYKGLATYRGGSFKSWLLRIAINGCYDRLRAQKRKPTLSLNMLVDQAETTGGADLSLLEDPKSDLNNFIAQRELGQALSDALLTLPQDQRVAVVLSDVQGMTYEEIVELTQTSLGTVKSRINRGRSKVRDYLEKHRWLEK